MTEEEEEEEDGEKRGGSTWIRKLKFRLVRAMQLYQLLVSQIRLHTQYYHVYVGFSTERA
jgi:hypothetical protein